MRGVDLRKTGKKMLILEASHKYRRLFFKNRKTTPKIAKNL